MVYAISIHAAREGGDRLFRLPRIRLAISIHAAREGGDRDSSRRTISTAISIHAAREGGDKAATHTKWAQIRFQSTPPVKAATARNTEACCKRLISIHAAREGGDVRKIISYADRCYFNPRRP